MTGILCPECGASVKPGKKFCGKCGAMASVPETEPQPKPVEVSSTAAAAPTSSTPKGLVGKSQISLDADALNLVLKSFVSQPDGPQLAFEGGELQCQSGDLSLNLKGLSLTDTEMQLKHKSKGAVHLTIRNLSLNGEGAALKFEVSKG